MAKNKYNPNIHSRRSIRLKDYDYAQAGLYFITICTKNRDCLFGRISSGEMKLNDAGENAYACWLEIPKHFSNTILHEFVIMPNHVHGIVEILGTNQNSAVDGAKNVSAVDGAKNVSADDGAKNVSADDGAKNVSAVDGAKNVSAVDGAKNVSADDGAKNVSPLRSPSKTIGSVVRGYKIGVTKWFLKNMGDEYPVGQSIWQRNYYDIIIRDQNAYQRISEYIQNNPAKWNED
jgi:putative transposase